MQLLSRNEFPDMPVKVLQFGEGNFLRAFIDWMINKMNKQGKLNSLVRLVRPIKSDAKLLINEQNGLYTLVLRGVQNGKVIEDYEQIECIANCLDCYTEWDKVVADFRSPDLRFIFSNTTEAGIEYKEEAYTPGVAQNTFPAKVTSLLYERFQSGLPGLILLPCELIPANGSTLKKYILQYASLWNLPKSFADYVNGQCIFVNTLVDRIVAGYSQEISDQLAKEKGYIDRQVDCGEIFHFFAIECDKKVLDELPLDKCGINVACSDDITPYRVRKVRFLNGAHTSCALPSILGGLTFVEEMMKDELFGKLVRQVIYKEVYPTVPLPDDEKTFFADSIVERFLNPFANHRLLSISLNSVAKFKERILPTFLDYINLKGENPKCLTFSLAALLRFYRIKAGDDGQYYGECEGISYQVKDTPSVLQFFAEKSQLDNAKLVHAALSNSDFWGMDLTTIPDLEETVAQILDAIDKKSIRTVLGEILK